MNEPTPGHTRYARNGAADIAFEELGGAGGEPLLLVMGLGVSRFWWPPGLVAELAGQGFHVAAYDQRDAGESTHFPAWPQVAGEVRALGVRHIRRGSGS